MDDERKYYDQDGNECTLNKLCRIEPEWAANRLRVAEAELEKMRAAIAVCMREEITLECSVDTIQSDEDAVEWFVNKAMEFEDISAAGRGAQNSD